MNLGTIVSTLLKFRNAFEESVGYSNAISAWFFLACPLGTNYKDQGRR